MALVKKKRTSRYRYSAVGNIIYVMAVFKGRPCPFVVALPLNGCRILLVVYNLLKMRGEELAFMVVGIIIKLDSVGDYRF